MSFFNIIGKLAIGTIASPKNIGRAIRVVRVGTNVQRDKLLAGERVRELAASSGVYLRGESDIMQFANEFHFIREIANNSVDRGGDDMWIFDTRMLKKHCVRKSSNSRTWAVTCKKDVYKFPIDGDYSKYSFSASCYQDIYAEMMEGGDKVEDIVVYEDDYVNERLFHVVDSVNKRQMLYHVVQKNGGQYRLERLPVNSEQEMLAMDDLLKDQWVELLILPTDNGKPVFVERWLIASRIYKLTVKKDGQPNWLEITRHA